VWYFDVDVFVFGYSYILWDMISVSGLRLFNLGLLIDCCC